MSAGNTWLMITRKVDQEDPRAGFAFQWVKKLGEKVSFLKVICMEKGETEGLADNIEIFSLGKEVGRGRAARYLTLQKFLWKLLPSCDRIFTHMNPEYTFAVWPSARIFGKKIFTWYTHGAVTWKTRLLEKMADVIFTASEQSFPIPSSKKVVVGHGIDTNYFRPLKRDAAQNGIMRLLTIGRISPTKDIESMILAVRNIQKQGGSVLFDIVGDLGLPHHNQYLISLKEMVKKMKLERTVRFCGPVSHRHTLSFYQQADIFLNLSGTGSIDKAVLEAMASGCLVLTSNRAFEKMLPEMLFTPSNSPDLLSQKIREIFSLSRADKDQIRTLLREEVVRHHNLDTLFERIVHFER